MSKNAHETVKKIVENRFRADQPRDASGKLDTGASRAEHKVAAAYHSKEAKKHAAEAAKAPNDASRQASLALFAHHQDAAAKASEAAIATN